ncbi:hypothetical protein OBBRIDRAFT_811058 [Obba rivulosa]|uniref:non-specific serine/threonine protein kinase n=1 Tax=Obba rivulosa TaxID=1052685 RepID=A0A8E2J593_9APHY|nr:hypothetical protein OBBRIDRAFT_811058 [Obba rivulosa]
MLSVQIKVEDDDGEVFKCEEEPHVLKPEYGFGYYLLTLGQKLDDGQLEVVRKLGFGLNSSVWLAKVHGSQRDHPGYKHCLRLDRIFVAMSRHGPHLCAATNVLDASVNQLLVDGPGVLPVTTLIRACLLALSACIISYCRPLPPDVKPSNTLMSLEHQDEAIDDALRTEPSETYEPRFEPELSPDPILTVRSQPLFDVAFDEVILGYPWSTAVNIWSVGCLDEFFDKEGRLLRIDNLSPDPIEERLRKYAFIYKDVPGTAAFIRRCLTIDPRDRPTAQQLLEDGWLRDA